MKDPKSPKFGLPDCLLVPIAAKDIKAIEKYVGTIIKATPARKNRINAVYVKPYGLPVQKNPNVKLWEHKSAVRFEKQLHPAKQVWVYVDYTAYRKAYIRFGMPTIRPGYFLDHVQNREAIRLRGYSHPYLRLCPVSRHVNTSGGAKYGGEGMEKDFLRSLPNRSKKEQESFRESLKYGIVYADPMDLTKMLDILPGTEVLPGVGEMLKLFYPE